jgi:predicted permease
LGIAIAVLSLPLIRAGLSHAAGVDATVNSAIGLSWPVLASTTSVCVVTAALFGLLPLSMPNLGFGGRTAAASRSFTPRRAGRSALIAAEIAIAVVVSFLGLLMIRSFQKLLAVDPGYRTDHLLTFEMTLPKPRYQDSSPQTQQCYDQFLAKLRAMPGVRAASATTQLPMHPSLVMTRFLIQGEAPVSPGSYPLAQMRFVTPEFFSTMGLAMENGRTFTRDEFDSGAPLVLVNRTFANRFLKRRDPLGAKVVLGVLSPQPASLPVIGVVADAHEVGVESETPPEIFLAGFGVHEVMLVRTDSDPRAIVPSIQALVKQTDPGLPVYNIQSMDEVVSESIALQRITMILLGCFALLALALATIGIYGVLAYSVAQRTREIGVRMAVGAQRRDIVTLFLRRTLEFAGFGILSGLAVAIAAARAMNALLFHTSPVDAVSAGETMIVLVLAVAIAVALPVRRAASLNPTEALRSE